MADSLSVTTPGGVIQAVADADDGYPGIVLQIEGTVAAVVEWHPEHKCLVLRTYNANQDDPQHYHRWDGTALPI